MVIVWPLELPLIVTTDNFKSEPGKCGTRKGCNMNVGHERETMRLNSHDLFVGTHSKLVVTPHVLVPLHVVSLLADQGNNRFELSSFCTRNSFDRLNNHLHLAP